MSYDPIHLIRRTFRSFKPVFRFWTFLFGRLYSFDNEGAVVGTKKSMTGCISVHDVGGDPSGLVAGEEMRRRPSSRLLLEIHVGERLTVGVADDEAGVGFLTTLSA